MNRLGKTVPVLAVPAMAVLGLLVGAWLAPVPVRAAEVCTYKACNVDTGRCFNTDWPLDCLEIYVGVLGIGWVCSSYECV